MVAQPPRLVRLDSPWLRKVLRTAVSNLLTRRLSWPSPCTKPMTDSAPALRTRSLTPSLLPGRFVFWYRTRSAPRYTDCKSRTVAFRLAPRMCKAFLSSLVAREFTLESRCPGTQHKTRLSGSSRSLGSAPKTRLLPHSEKGRNSFETLV